MINGLSYDDSEPPTIGLVPPGVSWDQVADHIKISHGPLLIGPDDSGCHVGAYWANTQMVLIEELSPDQQEAVDEFRELLIERGEI